ncbi:MAG: hypothetical protein Q8Q05_01915 [bacterium]|nr:hypothetical protein [bacterium]
MILRLGIVAVGLGMIATALLFPKPDTFSTVSYLALFGIGFVFVGVAASIGFWVDHNPSEKTPN